MPWKAGSAQGCHPCLRYVLSPMCRAGHTLKWRKGCPLQLLIKLGISYTSNPVPDRTHKLTRKEHRLSERGAGGGHEQPNMVAIADGGLPGRGSAVHRAAGSESEAKWERLRSQRRRSHRRAQPIYSLSARPVASGADPFSPSIPFCRLRPRRSQGLPPTKAFS